jgi:uncharacterized protein (DUF1800 family)
VVSDRERIAHVARRLGMGAHPDLVNAARTADDAIAAALDLSAPAAAPYTLAAPADPEEATEPGRLGPAIGWWIGEMANSRRLVEERLAWFWTDHFATSMAKVRSADLMVRQHATIRAHATGSFADLLRAITVDGAMLVYLDGVNNHVDGLNENHARELFELHTLGRGNYSQADVRAAASALSGWLVNAPFRKRLKRAAGDRAPFESFFFPLRHDDRETTLLGVRGRHDVETLIDVILDQPATPRFVAAKLYTALVGLDADTATVDRLAEVFARDWSTLALVDAIVSTSAFTSDAAVRAHVRTPLEKLVGLLQAIGRDVDLRREGAGVGDALRNVAYVPFVPPDPSGYAKGSALLGPHQLVHALDLGVIVPDTLPDRASREWLARFGIHDVDAATLAVLDRAGDPRTRVLLALASPEFALR